MEVHFCGVASEKGKKHLGKLSKNTQIVLAITLVLLFLTYHSVEIIVFDGYAPSIKDVTHRKRSGTVFKLVEIKNDNPGTSDQSKFFSNCIN